MPYEKQIFVDGEVLTAEQLNHIEDGLEYVTDTAEAGGGAGGYYTPSVSQPSEDTMQVDYTPSADDMPTVTPVTVTLPTGPQGEQGPQGPAGADGHTPVRGVDYWTAEDVAQIVADTKAEVEAAGRYELIETITTTEEVSEITRSQEPDGTAYAFKDLFVRVKGTADPPVSGKWLLWKVRFGALDRPCFRNVTIGYSLGYPETLMKTEREGNWRNLTMSGSHTNYGYLDGDASDWKRTLYTTITNENITKMAFAHQTAFPVGTTFEIYGVRA